MDMTAKEELKQDKNLRRRDTCKNVLINLLSAKIKEKNTKRKSKDKTSQSSMINTSKIVRPNKLELTEAKEFQISSILRT